MSSTNLHSALALLLLPVSVFALCATAFTFLDEHSESGDTYNIGDNSSPPSWLTSVAGDWMGDLPDSTKLNQISIPGTHDSAAKTEILYCETQVWGLRGQLEAGIRYLDIRTRRSGTVFTIHHGLCYLDINFGGVLNEVISFLYAHPKETVLMRVKEEHTPGPNSEAFIQIWNRYMVNYGPYLVQGLNQDNIPTLGALRGKIVALRNFDEADTYGLPYSSTITDIQDNYKITLFRFTTIPRKKSLVESYIHRAATSPKMVLNHLSGVGDGISPVAVAKSLNPGTYDYLGQSNRKRTVGVLIMDYPGSKLVYRILKTNFSPSRRCQPRSWATYSKKTYARFEMPSADEGKVITIKFGAYARYVFPKCHRATWTNLRFMCTSAGSWERTSGSWDADGLCHSIRTNQAYLKIGKR